MVFAAVPTMVKTLLARADSSFYCWDAVQAYESVQCGFIIVARKTARLVEELKVAEWQGSPTPLERQPPIAHHLLKRADRPLLTALRHKIDDVHDHRVDGTACRACETGGRRAHQRRHTAAQGAQQLHVQAGSGYFGNRA
jgi:hypothetical protein